LIFRQGGGRTLRRLRYHQRGLHKANHNVDSTSASQYQDASYETEALTRRPCTNESRTLEPEFQGSK